MPRPWLTKEIAARITCSSSPSAKTTRLGKRAHALEDAVERAGDRIAPRRELRLVGAHVDDRPARDAGIHRRLGHRRRNRVDEARIERHRDDVVAPEPRARRPDRRPRPRRARPRGRASASACGGGDLHLHVDRRRLHVERAAEDVGKAQHVVDLVGIVGAAGRDDDVVADVRHLLGRDLGIGIGHREDDRVRRHGANHVVRERALRRTGRRRRRRRRAPPRGCARSCRRRAPTSTGSCPRCGPDRSTPLVSQRMTLFGAKPIALSSSVQAIPAAPAPFTTSFVFAMSRSVRWSALMRPGGGDDRGAVLVVVEDRECPSVRAGAPR